MPDATLDDFKELTSAVVMGEHPILPKPHWGQEAAMIAHWVDSLRGDLDAKDAENARLRNALNEAVEAMQDMVGYIQFWARSRWGYDKTIERVAEAIEGERAVCSSSLCGRTVNMSLTGGVRDEQGRPFHDCCLRMKRETGRG